MTNRNPMRGDTGRPSGQAFATCISINGPNCRPAPELERGEALCRDAASQQSNCGEVVRRSADLKAGAGAPPPAAADGLDPARSPVCWLGMRSVEDRAR